MDKQARPPSRPGLARGRSVGLMLAAGLMCLAAGYFAGHLAAQRAAPASGSSQRTGGPRAMRIKGPVCTNTCNLARNGVCDEGRSLAPSATANEGREAQVKCDLGTDCDDCGTWETKDEVTWGGYEGDKGPIALLMSKGIDVRVRKAKVNEAPFLFAYTDPAKDHDVSRHMHATGVVEPGITKIFYQIFKQGCVKADGSRALFVDVGGNFGWFSVLGALMGCRVITFEPVPHFRAFLEYSLHLNNVQGRVTVLSSVVSHLPGQQLTMVVPSAGIWGTAGIDGLNIDSSIPGALENVTVPSVSLDNTIKEDVLLLKVDVEGWEWSVMKGAHKLVTTRNVENIILEYSPGVGERNSRYDDILATVEMLVTMTEQGYRLAHLGEGKEAVGSYDSPLPVYEEVSPGNLKYDLEDAKLLQRLKMGCEPPPELGWPCNTFPEDVSPRSLRSAIGHNTNVWASRNQGLLKVQGTVGFMALDDPAEKWTITKSFYHAGIIYGMGMRMCLGIDPKYQVHHRCPCSNLSVCGAEENLVQRLAKEGRMPSNYVIKD